MVETKDILQDCLERIEAGESLEQVLARYPDQSEELTPLLTLATDIQTHRAQPMPASAKARVRYEIYGAARARQFKSPAPQWRTWVWRLALTAVVVLFLGGGGWVASAQSAPGKPLFPMRAAVNEARARLSPDPRFSIPLRLQIAEDRLADVQILRSQGRLYETAIFLMVGETESLMLALERSPEQVDRATLERASNLARAERALLRELSRNVPIPRARRNAETLLQLSETWEPSLERLLQKSR